MCEKGEPAGADLVFLDLEDACAPSAKDGRARQRGRRPHDAQLERADHHVRGRVNGIDTLWCHGDVVEVVTGARRVARRLIVPKARRARDVWWVRRPADPIGGEARAARARSALEVLIEEAEG